MKHLILIRHAIAEDRIVAAQSGIPDAARRLTEEGKKLMRKAALGLRGVVPDIHVLITSPWLRTVETADLLTAVFGQCPIVENRSMAPAGSWQKIPTALRNYPEESYIALVGHEPALGKMASWLLTGSNHSFILFKKGGACLIDFNGEVSPGTGKLRWALTPSQLRQLGSSQ